MSTRRHHAHGARSRAASDADPRRHRHRRGHDRRPTDRARRDDVPRKTASTVPARQAAPKGPGLGKPATPAQVEAADVSIGPDGAGLPPGSGTPAEGEAISARSASPVTGREGGDVDDRLVRGQGTLRARRHSRRLGATGRMRRPCSITCAARCPTRSRTRSPIRGLRAHGLLAQPQRDHRQGCRHGREGFAAGLDARSGIPSWLIPIASASLLRCQGDSPVALVSARRCR